MSTVPACPYCNKPSKSVNGEVIYPHRPDLARLNFFQCAPCDAYVGCHKADRSPLGSLANKADRSGRKRAHAAFDKLWKKDANGKYGPLYRKQAYAMLAEKFGKDEVHIAQMHGEDLKLVLDYTAQIFEEITDKTGYGINMIRLKELRNNSEWQDDYRFVMEMQKLDYFDTDQAMRLQDITSKLGEL